MILFSGTANLPLASTIAKQLNTSPSPLLSKRFSDGNLYLRVAEKVTQQTCVIIQTLGLKAVNNHFLELLFLLDALKRGGASEQLVVLPYFSYAKADRLETTGTSLRAAVCATCLQATGASKILALDLHSPKVSHYFNLPVINLSPVPFFTQHLKTLALTNPILVTPDQGYKATAENYAIALNLPVAAGHKTRRDDNEHVADITIKGDFDGKTAIIVDDFTTSGNSLIFLLNLLKRRGAKRVLACITHCLLDLEASNRLLNTGLDHFITTNSLANPALNPDHPQITRLDVAPLLASAITAALPPVKTPPTPAA